MKMKLKQFFKRYATEIAALFLVVVSFAVTMMMISSIRSGLVTEKTKTDTDAMADIPVIGTIPDETESDSNDRETSEKDESTPVSTEEYIIREYDGRIGIFRAGGTEPVRVIQVYVMYLPDSDREALRAGIRVVGDTELFELISDFEN